MGFLFKKKEVPEELPSLALEELNKNLGLPALPKPQNVQGGKYKPLPTQNFSQDAQPNAQSKPRLQSFENEQGYFKELVKSITEENKNVEKLDSWYKNKFAPGDMVFQMREYWKKQQPEILLKNISGELKTRLLEQTNKLHSLEKEWQEIYFNLIGKEEKIRKEEKELKDSLAEFISLHKKSLVKDSPSVSKGRRKKPH